MKASLPEKFLLPKELKEIASARRKVYEIQPDLSNHVKKFVIFTEFLNTI